MSEQQKKKKRSSEEIDRIFPAVKAEVDAGMSVDEACYLHGISTSSFFNRTRPKRVVRVAANGDSEPKVTPVVAEKKRPVIAENGHNVTMITGNPGVVAELMRNLGMVQ